MHQPDRLHRSQLVRLLQHWAQPLAALERLDVAEQLSQWLGTVDAVQLSRALHALESAGPANASMQGAHVDVGALECGVRNLQEELAALLTASPAPPKPLRERADNTPVEGPDPAAEGEFAVHAARYQALQKQVEARVGGLRAQMRQRLSAGPAALRQLAMLDTVMEQMLGAREQRLWATLPTHLERRMAQLRAAHQQRLEAAGEADVPQHWRAPGGWLSLFDQDVRALLLCEIELRMQPLRGLVEAAATHSQSHSQAPRKKAADPSQRTRQQIAGMIE
jgi:hypothetical protein